METPESLQKALDDRLCHKTYHSQELIDNNPPKIRHANKKIVFDKACPTNSVHNSQIYFSRWQALPLPVEFAVDKHQCHNIMREDVFSYQSEGSNCIEWHVNFAHSALFVAYGGPLFAQDEMQVAEHPILGSLREALIKESGELRPITRDDDQPTPVLIRGVERRCSVDVSPNRWQGRPQGLYGNLFAKATQKAIAKATTVIHPPTITNIIAMEAPSGGESTYQREEIQDILSTAYSSFRAAQIESQIENKEGALIHTGNWGTGAYGGNAVLMALLQLFAAKLATVNTLVFHTFNSTGTAAYQKAQQILQKLLATNKPVQQIMDEIEAMKFAWGVSDGN